MAGKPKAYQSGARGARQAGFKADPITNSEARGDAVYGGIWGALRPLDEIAIKMESKWGHDRLETLVTPETASKFAMVRERLNKAIDAADLNRVQQEAGILYRGWIALDAEASRLGAPVIPPGVWSATSDSGKPYRIVLTDEDKHGLCANLDRDEASRVLSIDELLRIYEHDQLAIVREAQRLFPGATITYAGKGRNLGGDVLEEVGPLFGTPRAQGLDDDIPF